MHWAGLGHLAPSTPLSGDLDFRIPAMSRDVVDRPALQATPPPSFTPSHPSHPNLAWVATQISFRDHPRSSVVHVSDLAVPIHPFQRHPDDRKATARILQRGRRSEGPCACLSDRSIARFLAFQFPDYPITQLPNPGRGVSPRGPTRNLDHLAWDIPSHPSQLPVNSQHIIDHSGLPLSYQLPTTNY